MPSDAPITGHHRRATTPASPAIAAPEMVECARYSRADLAFPASAPKFSAVHGLLFNALMISQICPYAVINSSAPVASPPLTGLPARIGMTLGDLGREHLNKEQVIRQSGEAKRLARGRLRPLG